MNMKKAALRMSLMMGLSMSFVLSMIGLLSAGKFTIGSFISSFLLSFAVSMVLGFLIPMKKASDSLISKLKLRHGTLKTRLFETLISDLIYTPAMTFLMVCLAYRQATAHGARLQFFPMFLKSLCISFIAAFILIFVLTPIFMKIAFKREK